LSRSNKINIIVSTLLLALFLYLAFRNVNLKELVDILEHTNYFYVFIGMFMGAVLGSVVRAIRWGVMLEPVKKDIPFSSLFATTAIGYMVNNLIPRSGEVVRPYLLGKREQISRTSAFATIIVERILDTVMFLLMFGMGLIYFKNRITNAIPSINTAVFVLSGAILLLTLWIVLMMLKPEASFKVFRAVTKILPAKLTTRVEHIFDSLLSGFVVLKKPSLFFRIAFWSCLLWLVYLISTYLPFFAFDINLSEGSNLWHSLWDANLLLVLINVAMFIPAPAATGPYHYICKVTLVNIFGVMESKALGYATATHAMSFLIYLVMGLIFFITSQYKISELKQSESSA
jgi:glycosyltransferase 2 family protein